MFLHSLKITNLLSFGPDPVTVALEPLNVIIGANGSGKSNFLEVIGLLQAAPRDINKPIGDAGGIEEWLWKGAGSREVVAEVEAVVQPHLDNKPLRHRVAFTRNGRFFQFDQEHIETSTPYDGHKHPYVIYKLQAGKAWFNVKEKGEIVRRDLKMEDVEPDQSVLSQRRDPDIYPEMTKLGDGYQRIRMYREWSIGRFTMARQPQDARTRKDFLNEDFSNLGLMVNRLRQSPETKRAFLEKLKILNNDIEDFDVVIDDTRVQVFLQEKGVNISATRLSDGTLRYLCLLAILLHPAPPPLVCIEEPELGLHPDILPSLAQLLKDASQRMQIIVTTQSDILVNEFTETPNAVIVCDKENMRTRLRRLNRDDLAGWLGDYNLGVGWLEGLFGGTRW